MQTSRLPEGKEMVADERAVLVALARCPQLEPATWRALVRRMGSALAVWESATSDWVRHVKLRMETSQRLDSWRRTYRDWGAEARLAESGIRCVAADDDEWPSGVNALSDPPQMLFVLGQNVAWNRAQAVVVAIVGTRRASGYGLEAARWIAETFAAAKCVVISGLALGIDAQAHRAALGRGGQTIAFLASGVDVCYPSSHQALYQQICLQGAVWSEYAPGSPVQKHHFPERNRLIAAVSQAIVVVQAGDRSGALLTAAAGLEIGRDIYAVPGPITSVHFRGCNRLLQDGARLLVDPVDCLLDFGLSVPVVAAPAVPERWRRLFDVLDRPTDAATVATTLQLPMGEVYAGLLELELIGLVKRLPGGLYLRHVSLS